MFTVSHNILTESATTALIVKDMSAIIRNAVPFDISNGTTKKYTFKAMAQGESVTRLSGGVEPVMLNRLLCVPDIEHSLTSVPALCDDVHTV